MTLPNNSGDLFTPADAEGIAAAANALVGMPAPRGGATLAAAQEGAVTFGALMQTNPQYDGKYWARLRALYRGGQAIYGNRAVLEDIFPRHRGEVAEIYNERIARSHYTPVASEVIDHLISSLCLSELKPKLKNENGESVTGDEDVEIPEFYSCFTEDLSPRGGERQSLNEHARAIVLEAMQTRVAWVLVDLPRMSRAGVPLPEVFDDRLQQEKDGALDAYAVILPCESVLDWEIAENGELEMAVVYSKSSKRRSLREGRNMVHHVWHYYTRDTWERFELIHKKDAPPTENTPVQRVARGPIAAGRVPIERFELPEGLWMMAKLDSPVRELFNSSSALSWGQFQSLLPELYEFLAPEEPGPGVTVGANQEDADRATNQARGQGYVQVRGSEDRAEYVGPDPTAFKQVAESCKEREASIKRTTFTAALTIDNSGAAVGRSGESKEKDAAPTTIVLRHLGQLVREYCIRLYELVSRVRGDADLADRWDADGMEKFDETNVDKEIANAVNVGAINIPSPTFHRIYAAGLAADILGTRATPNDLEVIREELEELITKEQFEAPLGGEEDGGSGDGKDGGDESSDEDEGDTPEEKQVHEVRITAPAFTSKRKPR